MNEYKWMQRAVVLLVLLALSTSACGTFEIEPEPLVPTAEPVTAVTVMSEPPTEPEQEPTPPAAEPAPASQAEPAAPGEEVTESGETMTYVNDEYGFSLAYPAGWTVAEANDSDFVGPGSRSVQFSQGTVKLIVGYRRLGEETPIMGSGAPAGEIAVHGHVQVGDQQVARQVLVFEGQDKAVFYGQLPDPIIVDGLQFVPRLDDFNPDYEQAALSPAVQAEADAIVGSLEVLASRTTASPAAVEYDFSDWIVYRNDQVGYTLMHPPQTEVMGGNRAEGVEFVGPVVGNDHWPWFIVQHYDSAFYHPAAGTDVRQYISASGIPYEPSAEELTIGGLPAVHIAVEASPQAYGSDEYYVIRGEQLFHIVILHSGAGNDAELAGQFLSSFSFDS